MNIIELDKDKAYLITLENFDVEKAKELHNALLEVGIHTVIVNSAWFKVNKVKTLQLEK